MAGRIRRRYRSRRAEGMHRARRVRRVERHRIETARSTRKSGISTFFRDAVSRVRYAAVSAGVWAVQGIRVGQEVTGSGTEWVLDRVFPAKASVERDPGVPFLVVGHRGSPVEEVENTLPSFRRALEIDGANALEIDLCITRDREVVVFHDWDPDSGVSLARQAGGEVEVRYRPVVPPLGSRSRRPVCRLSLDDLREHYRFADIETGDVREAHIPSFDEFAAFAAGQPGLRAVFLDVKVPPERVDLVEPLVLGVERALAAHPGEYEVVYLSPEERVVAELRKHAGSRTWSLDVVVPPGLVVKPSKFSAVAKAIDLGLPCASAGKPVLTLAGWWLYRRVVAQDLAARVKHNEAHPGRRIDRFVAWTVNDERQLRMLYDFGVQGILTDYPARLRGIAAEDDDGAVATAPPPNPAPAPAPAGPER